MRNSLRFVPRKDYKAVTRDLKAIYQAPTEEAGQHALEAFASAWDKPLPADKPELAGKLDQPGDVLRFTRQTSAR